MRGVSTYGRKDCRCQLGLLAGVADICKKGGSLDARPLTKVYGHTSCGQILRPPESISNLL